MNRYFQVCIILLLVMTASCTIEKRQYSSGYYISYPGKEKSISNYEQRVAVLNKQEEQTTIFEEKVIEIGSTMPVPMDVPAKKFASTSDNSTNASVGKEKNKKLSFAKHAQEYLLPDDDGPKKDAKQLLLGSIGSFLVAMLYGLFLGAGATTLAEIIFILIPFSIIGLWIWSLILHNKYSAEDSSASPEKKKEVVYSQRKAFLLAGFLGIFGAHRFYLGYPKMGMLEMFTLGGFFILYFIDLIRIKFGKLKPFNGTYERGESTYTRGKKSKVPNKTLRLIKWSLVISLLALLFFLGFAIFLAPSLV
jgi:TM2 domain-containing membrane protein YozV